MKHFTIYCPVCISRKDSYIPYYYGNHFALVYLFIWFICPGFSTENPASQETLSVMSWKTPQLLANLYRWSGFPDTSGGK